MITTQRKGQRAHRLLLYQPVRESTSLKPGLKEYRVYCSVTLATRYLAGQLMRELCGNGFVVSRRLLWQGDNDLAKVQLSMEKARVILLLSSGDEMPEKRREELQLALCWRRPIILLCLQSSGRVGLTLLGWSRQGPISERVQVGYQEALTLINRALWEARTALQSL